MAGTVFQKNVRLPSVLLGNFEVCRKGKPWLRDKITKQYGKQDPIQLKTKTLYERREGKGPEGHVGGAELLAVNLQRNLLCFHVLPTFSATHFYNQEK